MEQLVTVEMLGNLENWILGKTYDIPMTRANELAGIGFAKIIAVKPTTKEKE